MNGEPTNALATIDGQVLPSEPVRQQMIRPLATPDEALDAWQAFQTLKAKLITADDTQHVSGKDRITKSGWRKIAAAFGIDTVLIKETRLPKETGGGFVVECVVRAIAPNGRHCDGVGSFDSTERRMAHPEHDVRATAFTRACNRAISDLVGGGEVSAEEIKAESTLSGEVSAEEIKAESTLSREQANELITQFERSCDQQGVAFDHRTLATLLLQHVDDLRRAFKHFKGQGDGQPTVTMQDIVDAQTAMRADDPEDPSVDEDGTPRYAAGAALHPTPRQR